MYKPTKRIPEGTSAFVGLTKNVRNLSGRGIKHEKCHYVGIDGKSP